MDKLDREYLKQEIKQKLKGNLIHQSIVLQKYVTKKNDEGKEIQVPVFVGNTLRKEPKEIRRENLIHNNSKRRRLAKMRLD